MGDFDTGDAHSNPFTRENIFAISLSFQPVCPRQVHHGVRPPGKGTSLVTTNALERPSVPRSYESLMKKPARRGPIILDEFGYVPLDVESTRQLLKAISTHYGRPRHIIRNQHRVRETEHRTRRREDRRRRGRRSRPPRPPRRVRRAEQTDGRGVGIHSSTMKPALGMRAIPTVRHGRAGRRQAAARQQPGRTRHQAVRHRPQELPIQRHFAQHRGIGGDVLDRDHSQGKRPEPAQVREVAARGDAQREGPERPGLPGLADAVVGVVPTGAR